METRNKVKWRGGMQVTPATFEAADKFEIAMHRIGRQMVTHRLFGILPANNVNISTSTNGNIVVVTINDLVAVGRNGETIQIKNDKATLNLPKGYDPQCYVTIYHDGFVEQEFNGIIFDKDSFAYELCAAGNIDASRFPIAKLVHANNVWQVQKEYIPPILSLDTHSFMMQHLEAAKRHLNTIIEQLEIKHPSIDVRNLKAYAVELDYFSGVETPEEYHHLLHKIATVLSWSKLYHIEQQTIRDVLFDQNDILNSIVPLEQCVKTFYERITSEVIKVEEPEVIEPYIEL